MKVIAVTGGSASGKTTLALQLQAALKCALISEDDYYRDNANTPGFKADTFNFDAPTARDHDLLVKHLLELKSGESILRPTYCFAQHRRLAERQVIVPGAYLLLEGLHLLFSPGLRACIDFSVYIDVPADVRLARRLLRDVAERQRTPQGVVDQYLATVRPSHQRFIEPCKAFANLICQPALANSSTEITNSAQTMLDCVLESLAAQGLWHPEK